MLPLLCVPLWGFSEPPTTLPSPLWPCLPACTQPGPPLTGFNMVTVVVRVVAGMRPSLQPVSDEWPGEAQQMVNLMRRCWDQDPKKRPCFPGSCLARPAQGTGELGGAGAHGGQGWSAWGAGQRLESAGEEVAAARATPEGSSRRWGTVCIIVLEEGSGGAGSRGQLRAAAALCSPVGGQVENPHQKGLGLALLLLSSLLRLVHPGPQHPHL